MASPGASETKGEVGDVNAERLGDLGLDGSNPAGISAVAASTRIPVEVLRAFVQWDGTFLDEKMPIVDMSPCEDAVLVMDDMPVLRDWVAFQLAMNFMNGTFEQASFSVSFVLKQELQLQRTFYFHCASMPKMCSFRVNKEFVSVVGFHRVLLWLWMDDTEKDFLWEKTSDLFETFMHNHGSLLQLVRFLKSEMPKGVLGWVLMLRFVMEPTNGIRAMDMVEFVVTRAIAGIEAFGLKTLVDLRSSTHENGLGAYLMDHRSMEAIAFGASLLGRLDLLEQIKELLHPSLLRKPMDAAILKGHLGVMKFFVTDVVATYDAYSKWSLFAGCKYGLLHRDRGEQNAWTLDVLMTAANEIEEREFYAQRALTQLFTEAFCLGLKPELERTAGFMKEHGINLFTACIDFPMIRYSDMTLTEFISEVKNRNLLGPIHPFLCLQTLMSTMRHHPKELMEVLQNFDEETQRLIAEVVVDEEMFSRFQLGETSKTREALNSFVANVLT